jgi:hypothetical protein
MVTRGTGETEMVAMCFVQYFMEVDPKKLLEITKPISIMAEGSSTLEIRKKVMNCFTRIKGGHIQKNMQYQNLISALTFITIITFV